MNTLKVTAFKVMALLVAMLAAIGAWEVYRGTVMKGQAQSYIPPDAARDHFLCYKLSGDDDEGRFEAAVELSNQFTDLLRQPEFKKVNDHEKFLCVPTAKQVISFKAKSGSSSYKHG